MQSDKLNSHPRAFTEHYIAAQPTPYSISSGGRPFHSGGVLNEGRDVWLQEANKVGIVSAFVDDLGMVILDARWLLRKSLRPAA